MPTRTVRRLAAVTLALAAALTWLPAAHAAGVINIDSCQFLTTPGTTYKLTTDLSSCGDCLAVLADRVTVDLQGHSITSTCEDFGSAVTDFGVPRDLIVIKDGAISAYPIGIGLFVSTRVTVVGLEVTGARFVGIGTGAKSLVKSCVARDNHPESIATGIAVGDRGQVQECDASNNNLGILCESQCLITRNTANNSAVGILAGSKSTVSFNTANDNGFFGISVGEGSLVTRNTATGNAGFVDFFVGCPSTVTFNTSSFGFPASYNLFGTGTGCHASNNQ